MMKGGERWTNLATLMGIPTLGLESQGEGNVNPLSCISRRQLLRALLVSAAGGVAAACQPKVVEKVVEVEKVVTQEVEKIVEKAVKETVVVTEVQQEVATPTPRVRAPGEKVVIRYGTSWPMWRIEVVNQGLAIFQQQNPDISVAIEMGGGTYRDKLATQMASATEPEVGIGNILHTQRYFDAGLCLDMLPAFESRGIDVRKEYRLLGVEFMGGKLYGTPWTTFAHGIFYNKTMFKEAGAPDPNDDLGGYWDWTEFLEACSAIKDETGKFPMFLSPNSLQYSLPEFIYGRCARLYDFQAYQYALNEEATVEAITWVMEELYNKGYIVPSEEAQEMTLAGMLDPFSGQAAAMAKQSAGWVGQTVDRVGDSFDWDIARCPTVTGSPDETMSHVTSDPNWVSARTAYRDEAIGLALFLAGDDMQNLLSKHKIGICALNRAAEVEGGFLQPPPASTSMMLEPWETRRILTEFFHHNTQEAGRIMTREMDYVILGEKTVQEACDTMQKECNDVIEYETKLMPESPWLVDFPNSLSACSS